MGISTHTLTWSVTRFCNWYELPRSISTHTLTWSVTPPVQSLSATTSYFNSHAHVERDCRFFLCRLFLCHFNSHAHVERDSAIALANKSTTISTHTLTWSVTLSSLCQMIYLKHFNSHAHVERDLARLLHRNFQFISTHTLTWSVTSAQANSSRQGFISTHTLTWSVTVLLLFL